MDYRLEDLIDISLFQQLQDKINNIFPFPSAIIDNKGNILTSTAWQDICTKFHRTHPECQKECIKSDRYILDHIDEADPALIYTCPHGLTDTAIPIIIEGRHLVNFFTGQFFLREPDLDYFRKQAKKYGFDENSYLRAVKDAPVLSEDRMEKYHSVIKTIIDILTRQVASRINEHEKDEILRAQMGKYHILFESMRQGVFYQRKDGTFSDINKAALDVLGLSKDEFISKNSYDYSEWKLINKDGTLLKPEEHPSMITLKSGKPSNDKLIGVYNKKQKDYVWVVANAHPVFEGENQALSQVMVTMHDITKIKKSERILKESEARFRSIFENSPSGMLLLSIDGKFLKVNNSLCNIFGYKEEELLSKTFLEITHKDDIESSSAWVKNLLSNKVKVANFEKRYITKSGKTIVCFLQTSLHRDFSGNPLYFVTHIIDISERRQTENNLKNKIEELERFNLLTLDREFRMIELKKEVNELCLELGRENKYRLPK